MRATGWMILALLALPGMLVAQGRGPDQERRAQLEQQVRRQFLAQVGQRLGLTDEQREAVRAVLADGAEARRDLALESQGLRIDLMQAVRDEDASMDRFEDILDRLDSLHARERELEDREEARLSEILDPRQEAIFLMMRMQLNDRIRQMRGMMRGGGMGQGMGGGPPDGGWPFL